MKVNLKTTFESYGKYVTGHIEDTEMYEKVKSGANWWKDTIYPRITHIRIPKAVFERLLKLDRSADRKQSEGEWISNELGGYKYAFYCSECGWVDGYPFSDRHKFCTNCGAKMKGGE